MKLLCLSNGHGEDAIALRILNQLQQLSPSLEITALPLVGEGIAYNQKEITIIGPVKQMPSGGFVYMDGREFLRDVKGGLLQLTLSQLQAIRSWIGSAKAETEDIAILAVGDILPLLFASLTGVPYAFVGTAKSDYYLRDEVGFLKGHRWENWSGSVYLPWERCLMSRPQCKAVFPRDSLTTETLKKWPIPAYNLGNPMMDNLQVEELTETLDIGESEKWEKQRSLTIVCLPGSRPPEAYENWQQMMGCVEALMVQRQGFPPGSGKIVFLGAIAPNLSLPTFNQILESAGWHPQEDKEQALHADDSLYSQKNATFILTQNAYSQCLQKADFAIAMSGTATEQFVGLGKPAIAIPGNGPQFTPAFAEAQSRLLGASLILAQQPRDVAEIVQKLLRDPDLLQLIARNGKRRMGESGASRRIAECLIEKFSWQS